MQNKFQPWTVLTVIVASLLLAACANPAATVEKIAPAKVDKELKRVTLTAKAAERLDIHTVAVREEHVPRTRTVGAVVVTAPDGSGPGLGKVWVRVLLTEGDLKLVDRSQAALVITFDDEEADDDDEGVMAEADDGPEANETAELGDDEAEAALYYIVDNADNALIPGQRVFVELTLTGGEAALKIVPYAAVLYDVNGATWLYTNPEALVYVRESITVDYIDADTAYLTAGPAAGMHVVTVGGAELYGTEVGVSK